MGSIRLIGRSLGHYRRAHAGLLLGTMLSATIFTGALIVGDSADYTLRTYALQRIGNVHYAAYMRDRLFSDELSAALKTRLDNPVTTVLLLSGMAIRPEDAGGPRIQINRIQAFGVDDEFWRFAQGPPVRLSRDDVAVNERLADALRVKPGDYISLRMARPGLLTRDAPLSSREEEASRRANYRVGAIVLDEQMGRFNLSGSQIAPYNAYLHKEDLQQRMELAERANVLLIGPGAAPDAVQTALRRVWNPEYTGLRLVRRGNNVLQLEAERIFFDEAVGRAALAVPGAQGTLSYLVNSIRKGDRSSPYSFVTAGAQSEDLRDDEAAINDWLANALGTGPGDTITITYYAVLPSNRFVERSRDFTVKRVIPVSELALEKELVPEFPGLSDVDSCRDWKIGMPMDETLLKDPANEAYWKQFRQTPKAFITLAAGQEMWGNRFGRLTAARFPDSAGRENEIIRAVGRVLNPTASGLVLLPVHDDALDAANQATDLGGLFMGLSAFLLVSALILRSP